MPDEDLETWKQALWDFILEHCEITGRGSIFVKFHTSGRADLEKRIRARWKYGYHREDVRAKEAVKDHRHEEHATKKKQKYEKWQADKQERRRVMEEVRLANEAKLKRERRWGWLRHLGIKID